MDQLKSYADERLIAGCIYCGGNTESREHVPSRVLLDEPYPENLPVVPACDACNRGYSLDEQYFACLVECARTGSVETVQRPKIVRILRENPALAERISRARSISGERDISFSVELARAQSVVLKLARGHAVYEASETLRHSPSQIRITPLMSLDQAARNHFETIPSSAVWPEVGSRAMQRLIVFGGDVTDTGWIDVQPEQYRYFVVAEGPLMVRFVVSEYLACEVIWGYDDP
jgi:hypothetical protein